MASEYQSSFRPDYAIPPGETLQEVLDSLGMAQADLARRTGHSAKTINEIVKGKAPITAHTAIEFERVLAVPADFWTALETRYREALARRESQRRLEHETEVARLLPYAEMAKLGWVPPSTRALDRARNLLAFFGVASFDHLPTVQAADYRLGAPLGRTPSDLALAAWLRQGEVIARQRQTPAFDADRLRGRLPDLRALTTRDPGEFQSALERACEDCGVTLVLLPHLRQTYAHGAVYWLSGERALMQVTIRGSYEDRFWFTVFHEIAHLLLHGKRRTFIEDDFGGQSEREREADAFAADVLIPPTEFAHLCAMGPTYSEVAVRQFASDTGVCPGIVVGRLQFEKLLPPTHLNRLRKRFVWSVSQ